MDSETRQAIYNACDPSESLKPGDPRYVDLDSYGAPNEPARGLQWVDTLARGCEFGERPGAIFLAGQRGAGLTTELRRLQEQVGREAGAALAVGWCDADKAWDLREVPQAVELLLLVVATAAAIPEFPDDSPHDDPTLQLLKEAVPELFSETDRFDLAAFESLRARPALREELRTLMDGRLGAIVDHAMASLTRVAERARRAGRKGVGVVVDGFTKLNPAGDAWIDSADAAWKTLRQWCGELPVFLWQTLPPVLTLQQDALVFPMVQVRGEVRDRQPTFGNRPGIQGLRDIIRRRVADANLSAKLGSNWLERLDALCARSSGCPGDLLAIVRACFTASEEPLSPNTMHHLCSQLERSRGIPTNRDQNWGPLGFQSNKLAEAHRSLKSRQVLAYHDMDPWLGTATSSLYHAFVLAPPVDLLPPF